MTEEDRKTLRKSLLDQLEQVSAKASAHETRLSSDHADEVRDVLETTSHRVESQLDAQIAESEENLIAKIGHALERMDQGNYGLCEHCGGEIPLARLQAKPSATLCVGCQEKKENGAH